MNSSLIKLGYRIKEARLNKSLSIRDLGELSDISFSYISALERGKYQPARDKLIKLANTLDLDVDNLLNLAGYATSINNQEMIPGAIPIGTLIHIPVIGTVKAGPNGIAFEEPLGFELAEKKDTNGGHYFYLVVKGDSMINDGIFPGDYVLIREQNDIEYGELAIAIVDGEEGTIKKIYKQPDSITLQAANQTYPPRVFVGKDMEQVRIVGKVKGLMRKF